MAEQIKETAASRDKQIVRVSIVGILANAMLASFKAVVGILSNSIAIVLDAVNNISDAASSVITIIGTKLAGKEPDKKHPFGYGRIEYISALLISGLVLYAGITSFVESVKKILTPEESDYSIASLVILGAAVLVKVFLGLYVKKNGEKLNSDSLVNSGKDALMDSLISASTLVAALVRVLFGYSIEAWLGAVISIVIIKSGIEMLSETLSHILGEPSDVKLINEVKKTVRSFPEVRGAFDLVLHDYGPDTYNGSVHIEVEDTLPVERLDDLNRKIMQKVLEEHNVLLSAIGVYSVNTKDDEVIALRKEISNLVLSHEHVKQIHGFYYDKKNKYVRFDIVISFSAPSRIEVFKTIKAQLKEKYPEMTFVLAMDMDYGEL